MKKKGILLIGSLAVMVVAMVFIAVALISRSSVTPTTSDAATVKKSPTLPLPENVTYQIRKLEFDKSSLFYSGVWGINNSGYTIGNATKFDNDIQINKSYIWDSKGKSLTLSPSVSDNTYLTRINNENVVLLQTLSSSEPYKGFVYDVNTSKLTELVYKAAINSKSTNTLSKASLSELNRKAQSKLNTLKFPNVKTPYTLPQDLCDIDCYEYIYTTDINDSSDVVADTEKGAVIWTNAGKANQKYYYLNDLLSSTFKITGYRVTTPQITNRSGNSLTIVNELHSITSDESQFIVYDFDVVKGTLSNPFRITRSFPAWYGTLSNITDSKQFAYLCVRNTTSVNSPKDSIGTIDMCYFSKDDNYMTEHSLSAELDKLSPRGITFLQGFMTKDGNFSGTMLSEKTTLTEMGDYFFYNPTKKEYVIMENLVKQGKILNMPTTGFIIPTGMNAGGDISINYETDVSDPNTSAIGVLVPYNRPGNTKTTK